MIIQKEVFKQIGLLLSGVVLSAQAYGQSFTPKKSYWSTGMDGFMLSSALLENNNQQLKLTTPRFTWFLQLGVHYHQDLSKNLGFFTGANIKNLGFIENVNDDSTVKRRSFAVGIPVGIKLGNLYKSRYLMLGGGVDFPFHFRERAYNAHGDKMVLSEWGSKQTATFMPYVFIGYQLNPFFFFKYTCYLNNFLNTGYTTSYEGITMQPYRDYQVQLMYISLGFHIPFYPRY